MADITENDLLRYLTGELGDANERQRIEQAISCDPIVGLKHDALLERLTPPSPGTLRRRAEFARQEQALHARIAFDNGANPAPGTFCGKLSFANTLRLTQAVAVKGIAESERLLIEFDHMPAGWELAGIGMFTPHPIEPLVVRRGKRPERTAEPASLVESRERAAERALLPQVVEFHGKTARGPISLGEASNAFGAKISINQGLMNSANVEYSFPAEYAVLGKARLQVECITDREVLEWGSLLDLRAEAAGAYGGEFELKRVTSDAIKRSVFLALEVAPCGPCDFDSLTASQFRKVVTHDYQMLVLHAADAGGSQRFEATFESDEERERWADAAACHFLRFLPVEPHAQA